MTQEELDRKRMEIGKEIQKHRIKQKISVEDLAARTGMGTATIKRFESGKFWINLKHYVLIRDALGLPTFSPNPQLTKVLSDVKEWLEIQDKVKNGSHIRLIEDVLKKAH